MCIRDRPWVWPEVRDAGTSGAGAVPLRSAQLMEQKKNEKKRPFTIVRLHRTRHVRNLRWRNVHKLAGTSEIFA